MAMKLNREPPPKWLVDMDPHLNDVHQGVPKLEFRDVWLGRGMSVTSTIHSGSEYFRKGFLKMLAVDVPTGWAKGPFCLHVYQNPLHIPHLNVSEQKQLSSNQLF